MACFRALSAAGCRVHLVHWPLNAEAPFKFDFSFCATHTVRPTSDKSLASFCQQANPDLVLVSGWVDKGYLAVCRSFYRRVSTVLSMDNRWRGSLKQWVAVLAAPFTLRRTFSHAFVPGRQQAVYAHRLGFAPSKIHLGFYAADVQHFADLFHRHFEAKKAKWPKRFLYLGRYLPHKGIFEMWRAFARFRLAHPEWELWCVGTGDSWNERHQTEGIRHFGFLQPSEMHDVLAQSGVYVLPSHTEPWGVSVQEMAAAGFPMVLSSAVGAAEMFEPEMAGVVRFQATHEDQLLNAFNEVASFSTEKLAAMAEQNHRRGTMNSPQVWAQTLLSMVSST